MTARWSYNPKTPDGAGEGEATSRRRVLTPPKFGTPGWFALYALAVATFPLWPIFR